MRIKEYTIVTAKTDIGSLVQKFIDQGWQPYGYVFLNRYGLLNQAMVQYETKEVVKKATKKEKPAND